MGVPELSVESGYSYSLRASTNTNNGRRYSAGGLGVGAGTPLIPASPGTRRGKGPGPMSDYSISSKGRVAARSATPVRGNWR
jgi:hypothetical protein